MLHPQVLAQERRFLLQIERPDTEDKGCERTEAREEEGDGRDESKKEAAGARSVATESTFSCDLEHHRRCRPSLPVSRAASGRRPYIPHEHRALDDLLYDQGACQATASA